MILVFGWVLLSIAVGVGARNRFDRSCVDWTVLALVISPLIAAAFLVASGPKAPKVKRNRGAKRLSPPQLPVDRLDAAIRAMRA